MQLRRNNAEGEFPSSLLYRTPRPTKTTEPRLIEVQWHWTGRVLFYNEVSEFKREEATADII